MATLKHACNRVTDAEAVAMSRFLVNNDGLFLGSSSAVNLVACVKSAKRLGKGKTIVTILCDAGHRHHSKFWYAINRILIFKPFIIVMLGMMTI